MLGALGLSEAEEEVYRALVPAGGTPVEDIVRRLGRTEAQARAQIASLERSGLVSPSMTRPGWWVAAPPAVALRALLNARRHELEQAEAAAADLAGVHRPEPASDFEEHADVVVGRSAVGQRFQQLQLAAVHEIRSFVTDTPVAVTGPENRAEDVASTRGVHYRVVIERDVLVGQGVRGEVLAGLRREEEIRVIERVPTKLLITDRTTAMVPFEAVGPEPAALVIRSPGLVELLIELFDHVWREAWPLRLGSTGQDAHGAPSGVEPDDYVEVPGGPTDLDKQILVLLLTGASDARIAKHLDLGLRTVQRRVRATMDFAGASTRIQLGFIAHERGWITRDDRTGRVTTGP